MTNGEITKIAQNAITQWGSLGAFVILAGWLIWIGKEHVRETSTQEHARLAKAAEYEHARFQARQKREAEQTGIIKRTCDTLQEQAVVKLDYNRKLLERFDAREEEWLPIMKEMGVILRELKDKQ